MTHVKVLEVGQSSQGTSEPITPVLYIAPNKIIRVARLEEINYLDDNLFVSCRRKSYHTECLVKSCSYVGVLGYTIVIII